HQRVLAENVVGVVLALDEIEPQAHVDAVAVIAGLAGGDGRRRMDVRVGYAGGDLPLRRHLPARGDLGVAPALPVAVFQVIQRSADIQRGRDRQGRVRTP